jgi:cyanamide hydratase
MADDDITRNGWTAVPVDAGVIFKDKQLIDSSPSILTVDIVFPSKDPVVSKTQAFAREQLSMQAYNHSIRVFYFGRQDTTRFILRLATMPLARTS